MEKISPRNEKKIDGKRKEVKTLQSKKLLKLPVSGLFRKKKDPKKSKILP